ncbi:hypothetical protein ACFP1Z_14075 [Streptomyces gamaensis]|uniref:Resolvase/invertase-type recombinase catalytic domain-containing protein n=1 Tax=Streptomyces gamaensis TaxID=1763542 RepID=A0ABW0YXK9_9ACTN
MLDRDGRPRAWGWVFGAREVDESEGGPPLYSDFEKDWSAQLDVISAWTERNGCVRAGYDIWSVRRPSGRLAAFLARAGVSVVVVAGARILERLREGWGEEEWAQFLGDLRAAGVRIEIAEPAGP